MSSEIPLAELAEILRSGPPLRWAALFGSAARGRHRADSDLDIGIVPIEADLTLHEEADLEARLARACGREVDLVRVDLGSTLLRYEVARDGILLHERSPGEFSAFRQRAAIEYAEFLPVFRAAADRFCARLVEKAKTLP